MPRQPRFAFENAFYHVFNRGINKQAIFLSDRDYRFFLKKLQQLKKKFDHSLYAYCLMPNHFHLSIQTRTVPISKIMASLSTSYSMYFNNAYDHFGSVFQNRFKSILIENNSYFRKLSQYIYRNPLVAGLVSDVLAYPYSSIREALGREPISLLDEDIVRLTGQTEGERKEYERFLLEENTQEDKTIVELFEKDQPVLGTNRFATNAQKKYLRRKVKKNV